ncbi:MAG: FAD binding domain-containing protein [Geminicoccaceae bacterium]
MYAFEYQRPSSVQDAVAAVKASEDGKFLAGGQTYIPTLKQRLAQPSALIDLGAISELKGIREEGGKVVIGAMTPHADVAESGIVEEKIAGLAYLASRIGDPQVRHRGTIGGSIANNDPTACYPAALVALGATVQTDRREIAAEDFFTGMFETALEDDELVIAVHFPVPEKSAYAKFANPASRYAIVGVFVAMTSDGPRVAVTGAGPCVFRASSIEQAIASGGAEAIDGATVDGSDFNEDIHASAAYRAHLVKVMAKRAMMALA